MNNLITEDIIKNAVNESIDNFMLEEGFKDTWNALKNSGLGKVWNGLKNGVSMYMDWRTNGQWNNKYGIYANGNGKMTEMYYLNKWFNFHLNEIKSVAQGMQNPNRAQGEIEWRYNEKGEKVGTQKINNYNGIKEYVIKNITPQNFNIWIKNYINDRESLNCIDKYIEDCFRQIKDIQTANYLLNISSFLASNFGKEYLTNKRENLDKSQQQIKQQNQDLPIPDSNGKFTLPQNRYPYNGKNKMYKGWVYSYDRNGKTILINPSNPQQAVFVPNN